MKNLKFSTKKSSDSMFNFFLRYFLPSFCYIEFIKKMAFFVAHPSFIRQLFFLLQQLFIESNWIPASHLLPAGITSVMLERSYFSACLGDLIYCLILNRPLPPAKEYCVLQIKNWRLISYLLLLYSLTSILFLVIRQNTRLSGSYARQRLQMR